MVEIWKPIKGYEGLYKISNLGRVISMNYRGTGEAKELKYLNTGKSARDGRGYYQISLWKNKKKKTAKIHRLVAEHFISNPYNKEQVNHIDGDTYNNNVGNLEWVSNSENQLHRHRVLGNTITNEQKIKMSRAKGGSRILCLETGQIFNTHAEIVEMMGISRGNIGNVMSGVSKSAGGYHFKYIGEDD